MSIEAVAQTAGVSIATVSRVFNTPELVRPSTRERVQDVARRLGYQANASARTLRMQRSQSIGVIVPTLCNPVFAECLEGIADSARAVGYSIIPSNSNYRVDEELAAAQALISRGVDGLVMVVADPQASPALRHVRDAALPYVLAYSRQPQHPCVSVDNEQAVADAVHRLAAAGHRRLAMVTGQLSASDRAGQRCRGFRRGLDECRLPAGPVIEVPFMEAALTQLNAFLGGFIGDSDADDRADDRAGEPRRPTAVICSNDLLAIRTIRAASRLGLSVPRDLSVVGFDGIALGADLTPSLATIAQPNHDIGRRSARLLLDALIEGRAPDAGDSISLDCHFRTGESMAPP